MSKRERDYKRGYEHGMDDFTKTPVGEGGRHYWSGYHDGCVTRQTLKAREQAEKARAAAVEAANAEKAAKLKKHEDDYSKGLVDGREGRTDTLIIWSDSYRVGNQTGKWEREAKEREPKTFLLVVSNDPEAPIEKVKANEIRVSPTGVLEFLLNGKVFRAQAPGHWRVVANGEDLVEAK